MMVNGLLFCLVFIWISAAAGAHVDERTVGIHLRKKACRNLGGLCVRRRKACPGDLPLETSPGRPFCNRRRRCCYPVPTTFEPTEVEEVVCGIEAIPSTRIVGGSYVETSRQYPWQVGIKTSTSPAEKYFCGGTIISNIHILTAAHCFYERGGTARCYRDVPNAVYVGYGRFKQNEANTILVIAFDFHTYNCQTYKDDIAVLTLSRPLIWNGAVRPICLPRDDSLIYVGRIGTVLGWGSVNGYNPSGPEPTEALQNTLKKAQMPVITNLECSRNNTGVTDTNICASTGKGWDGKPQGSGTCQGDSGGPLLVKQFGSENYVQVGITSFGVGCAAKNYPDVFTRVSKFLPFINYIAGSEKLYYLD